MSSFFMVIMNQPYCCFMNLCKHGLGKFHIKILIKQVEGLFVRIITKYILNIMSSVPTIKNKTN